MEKNDYGFCGLFFNSDKINNAINKINGELIYDKEGYGKIDKANQHITLLWGFTPEVKLGDVKPIMENFSSFKVEFNKLSLFNVGEYDVLKLDANCDELNECNGKLGILPHEKLHKDYLPHMTLCYLKKNKNNSKLIRDIKPFIIESNKIKFEDTDGNATFFNI